MRSSSERCARYLIVRMVNLLEELGSVALDSSVLIKHFRGSATMREKLDACAQLYLSTTALGELYAGAYVLENPRREFRKINSILPLMHVVGDSPLTAHVYGHVYAQLRRSGTLIPQNDIWIAASALLAGLPLATCDHHFTYVTGLTVLLW